MLVKIVSSCWCTIGQLIVTCDEHLNDQGANCHLEFAFLESYLAIDEYTIHKLIQNLLSEEELSY